MVGFVTAVNRVLADLNRGSDFASRVKEAIENAIVYYSGKRFAWNEARLGFTTADEYVSLSVAIVRIDTLTVDLSSSKEPLQHVTNEWIVGRKVDPNYTSDPVYYATLGRQLRLYPTPDQTYSFEATILQQYVDVSVSASDSASNIWLTEGLPLIQLRAEVEVLEHYIDGPEALAKADRLRVWEMENYQRLRSRANIEAGSGRVSPWI